MFPSISEIKQNSRILLRGNWAKCTAVTSIFFMCTCLETFLRQILMMIFKLQVLWMPLSNQDDSLYLILTSLFIVLFSSLYFVFLTFPLILGVIKWFWNMSEGQDPSLAVIFYYFSSFREYMRCVRIVLLLFVKMALVVFLSFIPYFIIQVITDPDIYNLLNVSMPLFVSSLRALSSIAVFTGFAISFLVAFVYVGFFIPAVKHPSLSARKTIALGKEVTKGLRNNFLSLLLNFAPLFFLCLLVIPFLFVFPYFMTSLVCLGRYMVFYKKVDNDYRWSRN